MVVTEALGWDTCMAMSRGHSEHSYLLVVPWCPGVLVVSLFADGRRIGVVTNFEGGSDGMVERVSPTHLRCAVQGQAE